MGQFKSNQNIIQALLPQFSDIMTDDEVEVFIYLYNNYKNSYMVSTSTQRELERLLDVFENRHFKRMKVGDIVYWKYSDEYYNINDVPLDLKSKSEDLLLVIEKSNNSIIVYRNDKIENIALKYVKFLKILDNG